MMKQQLTETDSVMKRKLLKRRRFPTSIAETSSEEYVVPAAKRSCQRRRRETIHACGEIHGGTSENKGPIVDALWLTLVKEAKPSQLVKYFTLSKKVMTKVVPKVVKENIPTFENSFENKVRSIRVLYSKGLLSKEKYKSIRLNLSMDVSKTSKRRASLKVMANTRLPKILPYDKLISFVNGTDIGNVKDIKDFCYDLDADEVVKGAYREIQPFLLQLTDMYVCLDQTSPFLLHFGSEPYHLRVALGADGAPFGKDDEATAWLVSFLNVGQQIASENDNFILAGANCDEGHISMRRYAQKLVSDIASIEGKSFYLPVSKASAKFSFELIPSDMKWASTFSGELGNAAFYFSPFGNVNNDNKFKVNASLGQSEQCTWKPWVYEERLQVVTKVEAKRKELDQTRLAQSTKRSKLLNYMRSMNSRQETTPLLGPLVDKIFAEPLHNSNNAWQQLHALMLVHANDKSKLPPNCTDPSKEPSCGLASHLTTLREIGASRLYKKVKKWCSQGRKGPLSYRFTGKETKKLCHKFTSILKAISREDDSPQQQLQICTFAFIGLQLRDAISRFSRVTITEGVLQEIKDSCKMYFNAYSLLLDTVTPTVWTIGHAIPYHTDILYRKLGVGLGVNTMQGREAKHVRISQYAKHATFSTRWNLVFRHDYITTVWLRQHDPASFVYHKSADVYVPKEIEQPDVCYCGSDKECTAEKCSLCSSQLYKSVERSAKTGVLDQYICNLLSVTS